MSTATLEERARQAIAAEDAARVQRKAQELADEDARTQREQARQATLAALAARLEALNTTQIDTARGKLAAALEEFADAVSAYNGEIDSVRAEAEAAGLQQARGVDLYRVDAMSGITIFPAAVRRQPTQTPIVDLIRDLYRRRFPRRQLNLNSPSD
jgi:hypothetical protein